MQRATVNTSASARQVQVGRFNEPTRSLSFNAGDTLETILANAGIELGASEGLWCNGEATLLSDLPEPGDYISIVGNKAGGVDPVEDETEVAPLEPAIVE